MDVIPDEERWLGVAIAIADGQPVDWNATAAESSASPDAGSSSLIGRLQALEQLVRGHEEIRGSSSTPNVGDTILTEASRKSPLSPQPLQVKWGPLVVIDKIGRGSFGDVYRAWDPRLDREVALKLLRDGQVRQGDRDSVIDEARFLAKVRHPNVVTVHGAERIDAQVGIWTEFVHGQTLAHLVRQQGPFGAPEATAIGIDLCRALAAVHQAGLLHRDIKAQNVMREHGGRFVLMDFGAGHDDVPTVAGGQHITGTPLYMAPELFLGAAADRRTDIYALGTLLFFLVTGRFPVAGRSIEDIRAAHASGDRTRVRDLRADVPAPFVRALEKALDSDPAQRYQTAGEMESAFDNLPTAAAVPILSQRRWWIAAAISGAVMLSLAGATVLQWGGGRQTGSGASPVGSFSLATRKLSLPEGVWPFSNPSDDGRFVAGMEMATEDAAIIDLATGNYRPLRMKRGDLSDGYASLGSLSPDGTMVAVDWHDDRGGSLRLARADGSRPRVLIDPGRDGDVWVYEWSRDGAFILALISRPGRANVIALVAVSDGGVREIRQVGPIVPDRMSLSPDGRYIAYDALRQSDSSDRDVFVLDAHTGEQWPLASSPSEDTSPVWSPDGRTLVFLSDRNRHPSLWAVRISQGRPQSPPSLLKDDVGRVWLHGFTAAGVLHYQLQAGFAEIYVAAIDGSSRPEPLSPRRAVSNFYPVWSRDGRYVAYASKRGGVGRGGGDRELWIHDTATGAEERVPIAGAIDRAYAWSSDAREILIARPGQGLMIVNRATGRARVVMDGLEGCGTWGPAGIVAQRQGDIVAVDPATARARRTIASGTQSRASCDGRSVLTRQPNGRLALINLESGTTWDWLDAGIESLGAHYLAPHAPSAAYVANRKSVNGQVKSLMIWDGVGAPRELLRATGPENFAFWGWAPDGQDLLVVRWTRRPNAPAAEPRGETLWRVRVDGGSPVSTGLALDDLRDVSINPDGRRVAFNAGMEKVEHWVMEHLLAR